MRQRCQRAGARVQRRMAAAVDEHVLPLAAEHLAGRPAAVGRLQHASLVEADVAQHQRQLVGHADAVVRIVHLQRAVEPEAHLRGRHHMRVIPEQPGVAHHEVVGERLAGLHLGLRDARHAVHLDRHAHAMPVDGGRLGQLVREVDDQAIADLGADQRPRAGRRRRSRP